MSVALDYETIVRKLLEKSRAGKIAWEKDQGRAWQLVCGLQEKDSFYRFEIV